jgi:hypothetical protein
VTVQQLSPLPAEFLLCDKERAPTCQLLSLLLFRKGLVRIQLHQIVMESFSCLSHLHSGDVDPQQPILHKLPAKYPLGSMQSDLFVASEDVL